MDTMYTWLKTKNITMKDQTYMEEALTHSSYVNEHKEVMEDNERLEFMGDAVLQLWTTKTLYALQPPIREGEMTTLRAQLVCEEALADYNKHFGWAKYLKLGVGEEKSGGRERESILADMFEAVLGALYLDLGMEPIEILLEEVVTPAISKPKREDVIDYKTQLQEYLQSDSRKTAHYEVLDVKGPSNRPEFEVGVYMDDIMLGKGKGLSKKKAEQMAAKNAFEKMVR